MAKLFKFPANSGEAGHNYPAGWSVIEGDPAVTAYRHYSAGDGHELAGYWRCTPGAFQVSYEKWEFCHLIEGRCIITEDGGAPVTLSAGDAFVVEPGFRGRWEIVETMTKHFVFVL